MVHQLVWPKHYHTNPQHTFPQTHKRPCSTHWCRVISWFGQGGTCVVGLCDSVWVTPAGVPSIASCFRVQNKMPGHHYKSLCVYFCPLTIINKTVHSQTVSLTWTTYPERNLKSFILLSPFTNTLPVILELDFRSARISNRLWLLQIEQKQT